MGRSKILVVFFKQKTAYEMRISDWSSDVCSSDLGRLEAVRKISFSVDQGQIVALVGSNGAGKSTTLKAIIGLMMPASGTLRFEGRDITSMGPAARVQADRKSTRLNSSH